jgi:hypothetical protein
MASALIKVLKKILSIDDAQETKKILKDVEHKMENIKTTLNSERHWFEICRDDSRGDKECFPDDG